MKLPRHVLVPVLCMQKKFQGSKENNCALPTMTASVLQLTIGMQKYAAA